MRIYEPDLRSVKERTRAKIEKRIGFREQPWRNGNAGTQGSPRTELDIEMTVYGHAAGELPFYEPAKGIRGNADGGMFLLTVPVHEGQDLLLINDRNSNKEQICRVVNVTIRDIMTSEVVVAFPFPNPEFWGLPATT